MNPRSCGACGVVCGPGERCLAGVCVPQRQSPTEPIAVEPIAIQDTWFERGPALGGRLDGLAVTPALDKTLMLLAASPGGGVWQINESGGGTWSFPRHYAAGDYSFVHLEWDAVRPGRLYGVTPTRWAEPIGPRVAPPPTVTPSRSSSHDPILIAGTRARTTG